MTEQIGLKWRAQQTYNQALGRYARKAFIDGDLNAKREIFSALGQNFLVKDKKVFIEANEWFIPIENAYPDLEAEYRRLELNKNLSDSQKREDFARIIFNWGAIREGLRNLIYEQDLEFPAWEAN